MNHWIIAPVVLPSVMAPILLLAMRHHLDLQRVFSVASGRWGSGRGAFAGRSAAFVSALASSGGVLVSFPALGSEAILLMLSERGISAASGSACSSGALKPSSVLKGMGLDEKRVHGSIRFSICRHTTIEEIDYALATIPQVIKKLQSIMPV